MDIMLAFKDNYFFTGSDWIKNVQYGLNDSGRKVLIPKSIIEKTLEEISHLEKGIERAMLLNSHLNSIPKMIQEYEQKSLELKKTILETCDCAFEMGCFKDESDYLNDKKKINYILDTHIKESNHILKKFGYPMSQEILKRQRKVELYKNMVRFMEGYNESVKLYALASHCPQQYSKSVLKCALKMFRETEQHTHYTDNPIFKNEFAPEVLDATNESLIKQGKEAVDKDHFSTFVDMFHSIYSSARTVYKKYVR